MICSNVGPPILLILSNIAILLSLYYSSIALFGLTLFTVCSPEVRLIFYTNMDIKYTIFNVNQWTTTKSR